ncbi:hypothetical protein [Chryseolinea lacunae]|uniref:Uncharacterized protein n=1 Tax=Chryseolinea lacunae TaxID=2801331 RepID=A0ABS1KM09_9BACT|nr:hypothetical protein [Chryseolinea lacunae]MBL0740485.1 hypothetical protein [Chryseolinea lacunae]
MISIIGVTKNYALQPALLDKHAKTLAWLSATMHWKSELAFFHKLLDEHAAVGVVRPDKTEIDHLQNLIFFYTVEVIEDMRKKLRNHESRLAKMLETKSEWDTQYYHEHDAIMNEAVALSARIELLKEDLKHWVAQHPLQKGDESIH